MNDFEKQLSDVLEATTPEPPKPYAFTPAAEVEPVESDAVVPIELDVVRARRRPRAGAWLAAAAVVVLGAGIAVAAVSADRSDTAPAAPDRSTAPTPTVRVCGGGAITDSIEFSSITKGVVTGRVSIRNTGATTCRLRVVPTVAVSDGEVGVTSPTLRTRFEKVVVPPGDLVLGPQDRVVLTARLQATGRCGSAGARDSGQPGLTVEDSNGFQITGDLPVADCALAPISLAAHTER